MDQCRGLPRILVEARIRLMLGLCRGLVSRLAADWCRFEACIRLMLRLCCGLVATLAADEAWHKF
eukprot:354803-Chlamydomonas_euryale.AAC.5